MSGVSEWSKGDPVIICWRVEDADGVHPLAVITECDLCGSKIYAGPATVAARSERGFHLICKECIPRLREAGHELKFGGRYHPGGPIPWEQN